MFRNFWKGFKEFTEKGSAFDMAVGVIVGATMTSVVNSLVKDIMMPPIGVLLGGVDFSQFFIVLKDSEGLLEHHRYATLAAAQAAGATTMNIGMFANAAISFLITMFAVFMLVRAVNKIRGRKITARECPYCFVGNVSIRATKCPACCSALKPAAS